MSHHDDDREPDRQAILARRAIFMTTALAALSCSASEEGRSVTSRASQAATTSSQSASSAALAPAAREERKRDWDARMKLAPPLDVASSIPEPESKELVYLRDRFRDLYQQLEQAWLEAPLSCGPVDAACAERWKQTAALIGKLRDAATPGPCSQPAGTALAQRSDAHDAFLLSLLAAFDAELAQAARTFGAQQTWPKLLESEAPPQVCLNCSVPKPRKVTEPLGGVLAILFEEGGATLPSAPTAAMNKALASISGVPIVMVRGHADPNETGDREGLSRARAQAVKDWLVKNGVEASRLRVMAYAADLPIQSSATADGRAVNRRVDFERPP